MAVGVGGGSFGLARMAYDIWTFKCEGGWALTDFHSPKQMRYMSGQGVVFLSTSSLKSIASSMNSSRFSLFRQT